MVVEGYVENGMVTVRLFHFSVFLDGPPFALENVAIFPDKHLGTCQATLQLPVEPSFRYDGKLSAMRLRIRTAVTYREIHRNGWHVVDTVEVVHAVAVGDVFLTAKNIDNLSSASSK